MFPVFRPPCQLECPCLTAVYQCRDSAILVEDQRFPQAADYHTPVSETADAISTRQGPANFKLHTAYMSAGVASETSPTVEPTPCVCHFGKEASGYKAGTGTAAAWIGLLRPLHRNTPGLDDDDAAVFWASPPVPPSKSSAGIAQGTMGAPHWTRPTPCCG